MQQTCTNCGAAFEVSDTDLALLQKITPEFNGQQFAIPPPTMCFDCRLQRRLAFYNCRSLYRRTCDFSQKPIVSIYSPDKPFTVYEKDIWYGDQWDPLEYGREFDFNRPFFEQLAELHRTVPQMSLAQLGNNQNSEYSNDNMRIKNSYLVFDGEQAEDCYYGHTFVGAKSCVDFVFLDHCELCYECVHCNDSYNLKYSRFCKNCSDSWFLRDCIGCKHCFGCANLRQKQYCIYNEQKTPEEYEAFVQQFRTTSHAAVQQVRSQAESFISTQPVKAVRGEQNINSTGDNLDNSKDTHMCFDSMRMQDSRYCTDCMMGCKDTMDVHVWGNSLELTYNCCVVGENSRNMLSNYYCLEGCSNIYYSLFCSRGSHHLFGCIGLRHQQNCVFNKQYSAAEYQQLVARIAQHMVDTGEWGQFFPPEISAFGYNETMAQTFFPLEKSAVTAKGWQWSEYEAPMEARGSIPAAQLPDDASAVPDDVLNWAILCEVTGKPFKLIKQELDFYRTQQLPLPRRHPDQRHADRYAFKNPYRLWQRQCSKCGKDVETSYSPEKSERVLCEECYYQDVY